MFSMTLAIRLLAAIAFLWLAAFDIRYRRLPNRLVLLVGGLFFVEVLALQLSLRYTLSHGLIALVTFVIGMAFSAAGWIGGGDAKLATAVFLWTGVGLALPVLMLISLLGLLVSLVSVFSGHFSSDSIVARPRGFAMMSSRRGVPYGIALALGGCAGVALPAVLHLPPQ